jgi:hypothetical protein
MFGHQRLPLPTSAIRSALVNTTSVTRSYYHNRQSRLRDNHPETLYPCHSWGVGLLRLHGIET